ncbi:MAG: hypothetical protein ACR2JB_04025 [Bryobacteraceae bacterium]
MTSARSPKSDLLEVLQKWLMSLGCVRFHGEAPRPNVNDFVTWAIILFEQSSALHGEVFEDERSSANELRLSRQTLNAQLTTLMTLAATLPEHV